MDPKAFVQDMIRRCEIRMEQATSLEQYEDAWQDLQDWQSKL